MVPYTETYLGNLLDSLEIKHFDTGIGTKILNADLIFLSLCSSNVFISLKTKLQRSKFLQSFYTKNTAPFLKKRYVSI